MNLKKDVPYMVYVNLGHREDRREELLPQFDELGLEVDRQPGISASIVRHSWGYKNERRYACSLAKRLAIRRGKHRKAEATLLFEDDVILAKDLHQRLDEITIPNDWAIFFLGCKHIDRPLFIAPGLVRVAKAVDHHAMIIRDKFYTKVIRGLSGLNRNSDRTIEFSDAKLSLLQNEIPCYAAYPNLAWQRFSYSDNLGFPMTSYYSDGRQRSARTAVMDIERSHYNELKKLEARSSK